MEDINNKRSKANVWWLSATSFFTDVSSEMIFPILPIFLKSVLGASFVMIGLIEGIAEGLASFLKYFSGYFSDLIRRRKGFTLLGYSLSAISKLFFALAASPLTILFFRSLDRIGKGVRTSPRDALIAESVSDQERGKYFGLHRASDTAGAVLGTLIAVGLLYYFQGITDGSEVVARAIRLILFLSFIPALIGVLLLFFVRETSSGAPAISRENLFAFGKFSTKFKSFLLVAALFGLANYSYSFYILRANDLGVALFLIPLIYLIYNIFYATSAYPAGRLSDKIGRTLILLGAFLLFALVNLGFAFVSKEIYLWPLFALYGLFIGLTDGVFKAFVSDLSAKEHQGEAFGIYHTIIGATTFLGNVAAGYLWQSYGPVWPFATSAVLIIAAAILLKFKFNGHSGILITQNGAKDFKGYRS